MLTIEAVATIDAEGTLTVRAPGPVPAGRHRVVVIIDEAAEIPATRRLPSLADFRANLGATTASGNAVVDARDSERS
jgi:riboflavin biosynthesis pyrimidine reductase